MISAQKLAHAVAHMSETEDEKKVLEKLMAFITQYGLEGMLPGVLRELEALKREEGMRDVLRIEAAHEISKKSLEYIKQKTGAGDAPVEIEQNPSLLGGFKAYYKGVEYEGSLDRVVKNLEAALKT